MGDTATKKPRRRACRGKTRAGKPCKATPLKGKSYCAAHDPDTPDSARFGSPDQARAAGQQGGRPRTPRPSEVARELVERNIIAVLRPYFATLGLELAEDGTATRCARPVKYVWAGVEEPAVEVEDLGAQIMAAEKLQDRIYGRPRQAVEVTGEDGGPVEQEHTLDESSRELIGELLRARARARS